MERGHTSPVARWDSLCTQRTVRGAGLGRVAGRGASPVHSDRRCDRRPRRALRWTGCAPDQSWKTAPGSPLGPTARFEKQCCGHVATPTRSRACGCFPASPAPPRPAEPVSLLSSGSQSPKCLLLGPLRKSFARRRAHEPTRRRWQFGRHIGITCGAQGCASGLCPGRSRAPRGAPAHLVLQSSVPGSSQSLALRDERSPGTKAAARGV